jgi:hypothetical protein
MSVRSRSQAIAATRSSICEPASFPLKAGITPLWNPGTTYAFGSSIDSLVYASSEPRFAFLASDASLSRSGPTLPVAFAGLYVWQPAHPFDANSALPAADPDAAVGNVPITVFGNAPVSPALPHPARAKASAAKGRRRRIAARV